MTRLRPGILSHLSISVVALQWIGNLLVFLLVAAWLQIPDSHAWQFVLSVLSGISLVLAFCWLQVGTFARVRRQATCAPLWLRIMGFALIASLWILLERWISSGTDHLWLHAAYWNSKLSPGQRVFFTPARLVSWMKLLILLVGSALFALVLPIVIEISTIGIARLSIQCVVRPYRKVIYWFAILVCSLGATQLTRAIVSWTPGAGVTGQIVSVAVRLGVAYTVDIFLWCVLIALTAAWIESAPAAVAEPVATP